MIFESKIQGIPCKVKVIDYYPYRPAARWGKEPNESDPPELEGLEYTILDRKGYKAPWLMKKLTAQDDERILEDYHLQVTGELYGYL